MTNNSFCTSKAQHFLRLNSVLQNGLLTVCRHVLRFALFLRSTFCCM